MKTFYRKSVQSIANQKGITLLELLIATILTGVIVAAVFQLYVTQHKNWNIQDQITDMQQNARAALDEMTRQIRMAGHELPLGIDGFETYNTDPDTIIIRYSDEGCSVPISENMSSASSEIKCDGEDLSCFYSGQYAYIFHPDSGGGEFFQITSVNSGSFLIEHGSVPLTRAYAKDAIVIALNQVKFYIDNTTDSEHPALVMDVPGLGATVYSENITDLQFKYKMKNGLVIDNPVLKNDIREVLMKVSAKTDRPNYAMSDTSFIYRDYVSGVNIRNLDI